MIKEGEAEVEENGIEKVKGKREEDGKRERGREREGGRKIT